MAAVATTAFASHAFLFAPFPPARRGARQNARCLPLPQRLPTWTCIPAPFLLHFLPRLLRTVGGRGRRLYHCLVGISMLLSVFNILCLDQDRARTRRTRTFGVAPYNAADRHCKTTATATRNGNGRPRRGVRRRVTAALVVASILNGGGLFTTIISPLANPTHVVCGRAPLRYAVDAPALCFFILHFLLALFVTLFACFLSFFAASPARACGLALSFCFLFLRARFALRTALPSSLLPAWHVVSAGHPCTPHLPSLPLCRQLLAPSCLYPNHATLPFLPPRMCLPHARCAMLMCGMVASSPCLSMLACLYLARQHISSSPISYLPLLHTFTFLCSCVCWHAVLRLFFSCLLTTIPAHGVCVICVADGLVFFGTGQLGWEVETT